MELAKNVEELVFLGGRNDRLLSSKREFFVQLNKFRIAITAKRFFELDRPLLASVRKSRRLIPSFKTSNKFVSFSVSHRVLHIRHYLRTV